MGNVNLVPIVLFISIALTLFGIVYLKSRENMALIERGINPKSINSLPKPFQSLKFGLLLCGCGVGLLLGMIGSGILSKYFPSLTDETQTVFFSMIGIFGGIGLIISYHIERKHLPDEKSGNPAEEITSGDRL